MQSEMGFPSSHQLKSYVASKSRLKLAAGGPVGDAGLVVLSDTDIIIPYRLFLSANLRKAILVSSNASVIRLFRRLVWRAIHNVGRHPNFWPQCQRIRCITCGFTSALPIRGHHETAEYPNLVGIRRLSFQTPT